MPLSPRGPVPVLRRAEPDAQTLLPLEGHFSKTESYLNLESKLTFPSAGERKKKKIMENKSDELAARLAMINQSWADSRSIPISPEYAK